MSRKKKFLSFRKRIELYSQNENYLQKIKYTLKSELFGSVLSKMLTNQIYVSTSRTGLPGATPGPVAVEDRWDRMNHSFRGEFHAK
jgi:hypothetical protein